MNTYAESIWFDCVSIEVGIKRELNRKKKIRRRGTQESEKNTKKVVTFVFFFVSFRFFLDDFVLVFF